MPNKDLCEIVVLLDRSGSMTSIKNDVEGGYKTFIADQKALPGKCNITLVQFDSTGIETVYESKDIQDVPELNLIPGGSTPLLDATGDTIDKVGARLAALPEESRPDKLLFMIITDGAENASRNFNLAQIKEKIKHQTEVYKWQFVFMASNIDAFGEASKLGIAKSAVSSFKSDAVGVAGVFSSNSASTTRYRSGGQYTVQ